MFDAGVNYDDQVDALLAERTSLKTATEKWQTKLLASVFQKHNGLLLKDNLRLAGITSDLFDLSVRPVSDASLEKIAGVLFPDATPATLADFYDRSKARRDVFTNLDDLTGHVMRTETTGSRQNANSGYFKGLDIDGKPVVLFRGWDGTKEQSDLVRFLDELETANPKARGLLPEILGRVDINGKSYLAMEDLRAIGQRANHANLTKDSFLAQCGDIFTPSFRKHIEQWGMNLGRTTLEEDYIFVKPDGSIRLGVPFRATDYIHDAKDMYAGLKSPAPAATAKAASTLS